MLSGTSRKFRKMKISLILVVPSSIFSHICVRIIYIRDIIPPMGNVYSYKRGHIKLSISIKYYHIIYTYILNYKYCPQLHLNRCINMIFTSITIKCFHYILLSCIRVYIDKYLYLFKL